MPPERSYPVNQEPVAWRYQMKEGWGDIWRVQSVKPTFEFPNNWRVEPLGVITAPAQAPVAWQVLSESGAVRLWAQTKDVAETYASARDLRCVPLYAAPQVTAHAQGVPDMRSALQLLASLDRIAEDFRDVQPCRHNNDNLIGELKIELAGLREALTGTSSVASTESPTGIVGEPRDDQQSNTEDYGNSPREIQKRGMQAMSPPPSTNCGSGE